MLLLICIILMYVIYYFIIYPILKYGILIFHCVFILKVSYSFPYMPPLPLLLLITIYLISFHAIQKVIDF